MLDGNQISDNLDDLLPNFLMKLPKLKYLLLQDNPIHPGDQDEKSLQVYRAKFKLWIKSLENLDMDQYGKKDEKMIEELREEEQLKINQVQIDMWFWSVVFNIKFRIFIFFTRGLGMGLGERVE